MRAYDPEDFRRTARAVVDRIDDHFARSPGPVVPWVEPTAQVEAWATR